MDKINLNNLFPGSVNRSRKPLNVYSLYNNKKSITENNIDFNINNFIAKKEEKKKKLEEIYKKVFRMCLKKINTANKIDQVDIIYDVPDNIFRNPDYDTYECLQFLQKRLRKLFLDALILSNKSIFISWINIESNRDKQKI